MQLLRGISSVRTRLTALTGTLIVFATVLAATAFPRLMLIGGLPATDEGVYAFQAQLIYSALSSGVGLPNSGTLALYPLLLSWTFSFAANHMILLRLCDLAVALVASWLLCRVLQYESGSQIGGALIALMVLFTMNQPVFIQNGFKNSIFAALIPLLFALRLAQDKSAGRNKSWLLIGALVGLAVLLRETFAPFLIVGALAILFVHGWRPCLRFGYGTALSGVLITITVALTRGGFNTLLDSYRGLSVIYESLASQRVPFFVSNGVAAAREAAIVLILGGLATIATLSELIRRERTVSWRRLALWTSFALVPLIEPASKIGFPYHFSVCLPGIAGLTALGWKSFVTGGHLPFKRCFASLALVTGVLMATPKAVALTASWPATRAALQSASTGRWPTDAITKSNYLVAANAIRKVASPGSTLSVSGFMYALYPLTGLLPASSDLSNLTATLIGLDLDESRFKRVLLACPPDILMTTTRTDWPGADTLNKVVVDTGLYQPVEVIPVATDKEYGGFGGTVYKRITEPSGACPIPASR